MKIKKAPAIAASARKPTRGIREGAWVKNEDPSVLISECLISFISIEGASMTRFNVFKTYLFFSDHDPGRPYLIDTIWHGNAWWLVSTWLQSHDAQEQIPERLIRLSGLRFQEVFHPEYRFLLNCSIPMSVFDGEEQAGYVVVDYPVLSHSQERGGTH